MIYIYVVCQYVGMSLCLQKIPMPKCMGGITWPKHAPAQSQFWAVKTDLWDPYYSHLLYVSMDDKEAKKNVHLEMRNLKQTELQRLKNRGKKG